ncbi:MAG TPA: nickel ABC transporter ATP-binding protein [Firmicutes bacterium]|jgi:cobalt/nickel transport system ATP-binding protein|nr:nickel ABC transporter ATP-binding protein [Bacillota bacterium]
MREIVYNLENVGYHYQQSLPVLANINMQIFKGEKIIILGANGCGKSTLLKMMDGLIFPNSGRIEAFGQILNERNLNNNPYEFRKKVGLVFQDSDMQLFCSSVFDEIAFAPLQLNWNQNNLQEHLEATLKDFGLMDLQDRPPYRLSGGEKKKVALASITIYNPEVLLLDEPTNGLDPRTQKWFLAQLADFNQKGTTLIIATHDLEIAKNLADRVIVMNERHEIEIIGKPEEIFMNEQLLADVNLI